MTISTFRFASKPTSDEINFPNSGDLDASLSALAADEKDPNAIAASAINDLFDYDAIARRVAGPHWSRFSVDVKKRFRAAVSHALRSECIRELTLLSSYSVIGEGTSDDDVLVVVSANPKQQTPVEWVFVFDQRSDTAHGVIFGEVDVVERIRTVVAKQIKSIGVARTIDNLQSGKLKVALKQR